jgi:hypothetical protein
MRIRAPAIVHLRSVSDIESDFRYSIASSLIAPALAAIAPSEFPEIKRQHLDPFQKYSAAYKKTENISQFLRRLPVRYNPNALDDAATVSSIQQPKEGIRPQINVLAYAP